MSPITLANAVNIGNNDLTVDLSSYALASGSSLLLFDAAPGQIYGDGPNYFDVVSVLGVANPADYHVVYDLPNGDILLTRVPEPCTALLFGLGLIVAVGAKQRLRIPLIALRCNPADHAVFTARCSHVRLQRAARRRRAPGI